MSSSEEYLDNLLKSLTEGGNADSEPSVSVTQDIAGTDDLQEASAPEEADDTMSMEDIEAMLASMGEGIAEEDPQPAEAAPTDDEMLFDELALDESMVAEEAGFGEEMASDELTLDESMLAEETGFGDETLLDELVPDENMLTEEPALDDGMLSEGTVLDDEMLSNELVLDESMLSDELTLEESMLSDELTLDESILSDELGSGDEAAVGDFALDEAMSDDTIPEENSASDDLNLDELGLGDLGLEDLGLEDLGLEDLGLEDLGLMERGQDEVEAGDDFMLEDGIEAEEGFALEDGAEASDDFALEDGFEAGDDFALEDGSEAGDDFALEETGEDDADLSALLASMSGDEDLSEINDLLEKSDQGIAIDDDMMALLGDAPEGEDGGDSFDFFSGEEAVEGGPDNTREITSEELAEGEDPKTKKQKKKEEKERKKREKQAKKAKNKNASQNESADGENTDGEGADDLAGLLDGIGEPEEEPKKQGFFARFMALLLEEDDEEGELGGVAGDLEDTGVIIGNLSEENKELLAELKAEDQQKKKDKKDKKEKKSNKGKKGKKAEAADGEEGGEGEGEAKPKKPKKEKKKKKEKEIDEGPKVPEKKLSKKKVTSVFLFCATIAASIIVVTMFLPEQMEKQEAHIAFDQDQYTQVYDLLYGKELNEEEEELFNKSNTILKVQRKLDSYENYTKMNMQLEALNALIEGVNRYQYLRNDAELYNVSGEAADIYAQILDALASNYGLSEADALDILSSGDDVTYSQRIQAVITGDIFVTEEPQPEGKQDVLPEEEEIIDRLQNN